MITNHTIGHYGQLGNQIFQYALLIGVSEKTGFEIKIPLENTKIELTGWENKDLYYGLKILDCFDIPDKICSSIEILSEINNTFKEKQHHYDPSVFDIPNNTSFVGQFETEKYFLHAKNRVKSSLKFKNNIKERAIYRFNYLSNRFNCSKDKKSVSLHVRQIRKLQSHIQQHHPFVPLEYYLQAINTFPEKDYDIFIFSDDLEWCKENIKGSNIIYCDWDTESNNPDFIDLCMITLCDHHIIANSTFSWWGAWLGEKDDTIIYAPKTWFGPALVHLNTSDIIPERWIKISSGAINPTIQTTSVILSPHDLYKPGDLIFDIGSNKGAKTDEYIAHQARIVCFEPQSFFASFLSHKYKNNQYVLNIEQKGLGSKPSILELEICTSAPTISTFAKHWKTGRFKNYNWDLKEKVNLITLDQAIEKYGMPQFCKIDTEGFEIEVLKGLTKSINCLSFEYALEFMSDAETCTRLCENLGLKFFNFILKEKPNFELKEWVYSSELFAELKRHYYDIDLWGDIYASVEKLI